MKVTADVRLSIIVLLLSGLVICVTARGADKNSEDKNTDAHVQLSGKPETRLAHWLITRNLRNIAIFQQLAQIESPKALRVNIDAHLVATLEVADALRKMLPGSSDAISSNQYYAPVKRWAADLDPTQMQRLRYASLISPIHYSTTEVKTLLSNPPGGTAPELKEELVRESLTDLHVFFRFHQVVNTNGAAATKKIRILLRNELEVAETFIESFPALADEVRLNESYIAATNWRKELK